MPPPSPAVAAPQDFPPAGPPALRAEETLLDSLVHHREVVESHLPLEDVQRIFRDRNVEFIAVQRTGRVLGLCSRGQIGFLMGSRFGFALNSAMPVESALTPRPLIIPHDLPVREVLARALSRHGGEFHEDVVLVDREQRLLGLIRVETLAQLQSTLVAQQVDELSQQHARLQQQNLELFQANHAARQSQGLYLGLFENHTLGVALLDQQGVIVQRNRQLEELINLGNGAVAAVSLAAWVAEAKRAEFLALLEAHARGEEAPGAREFMFNIPGRGSRLFRCSMGWIRETGQICACLDDITEQRGMERVMLQQEKQKLLDTLVGGIAHELNNKLTPVQGFADLLNSTADAGTRRYTELITTSVMEAAQIIKQLRQLSKPAGHEAHSLDLRRVVEETLLVLGFKLRDAGCRVSKHFSPHPVRVLADAGQLKQVTMNLVLNALDAMDGMSDAELTLTVDEVNGQARLVVTDNGTGIAPEVMGRIFDPFFTTKGPVLGTGLGLSLCFSIVRQHEGEIAVESTPGMGARFTVTFPQDMGAPPLFLPGPEERPPSRTTPARWGDQRVLVVEDEEVLRLLLQEMFSVQFGCRVDVAPNGVEALAAVRRETYALVISDIRMPMMSGTDFYLHLRETHPALARRFVFITGHPGEKALETQITEWNVPVIAKPFQLSRLIEICGPFLEISMPGRDIA
ncbi:MAG: hybrid sensor histidine kinase/response regulator [Rariglobus sp.]|nr:hybrid sensor histidine kinase/response regulator [Rariglobus sp.]